MMKMCEKKFFLGYALLALAVVMAVWDGGHGTGKFLVALVAFVVALTQLDLNGGKNNG